MKPWAQTAIVAEEEKFAPIGPNIYQWGLFLAGRVNCAEGRILSRLRLIHRIREARDAAIDAIAEELQAFATSSKFLGPLHVCLLHLLQYVH